MIQNTPWQKGLRFCHYHFNSIFLCSFWDKTLKAFQLLLFLHIDLIYITSVRISKLLCSEVELSVLKMLKFQVSLCQVEYYLPSFFFVNFSSYSIRSNYIWSAGKVCDANCVRTMGQPKIFWGLTYMLRHKKLAV